MFAILAQYLAELFRRRHRHYLGARRVDPSPCEGGSRPSRAGLPTTYCAHRSFEGVRKAAREVKLRADPSVISLTVVATAATRLLLTRSVFLEVVGLRLRISAAIDVTIGRDQDSANQTISEPRFGSIPLAAPKSPRKKIGDFFIRLALQIFPEYNSSIRIKETLIYRHFTGQSFQAGPGTQLSARTSRSSR